MARLCRLPWWAWLGAVLPLGMAVLRFWMASASSIDGHESPSWRQRQIMVAKVNVLVTVVGWGLFIGGMIYADRSTGIS